MKNGEFILKLKYPGISLEEQIEKKLLSVIEKKPQDPLRAPIIHMITEKAKELESLILNDRTIIDALASNINHIQQETERMLNTAFNSTIQNIINILMKEHLLCIKLLIDTETIDNILGMLQPDENAKKEYSININTTIPVQESHICLTTGETTNSIAENIEMKSPLLPESFIRQLGARIAKYLFEHRRFISFYNLPDKDYKHRREYMKNIKNNWEGRRKKAEELKRFTITGIEFRDIPDSEDEIINNFLFEIGMLLNIDTDSSGIIQPLINEMFGRKKPKNFPISGDINRSIKAISRN